MVSRIIFGALLALNLQASAELDLTPFVQVSEQEGIKEEITAFKNGAERVTWHSPHSWRISGEPTRATLVPPNATQAEARVEVAGPPSTGPFDETFARKLKEELTASLPREVTKIEWAEDEPSPLLMNGHPTYKVTFSYTLAAQRFTMAYWICNFTKQQIRFRLTARADEFARLQEIFRQSLYTWQGLE